MKLTPELCRELLEYNPATGQMFWKPRDKRFFKSLNSWSRWNNMYAGKPAGHTHVGATGYKCIHVGIFYHSRIAHRIAWMIMTGEYPPKQIDHINQDGTDNRWCNLRDGSRMNMLNTSRRRDNKSGIGGLSWDSRERKWVVRVTGLVGGAKKHKMVGRYRCKLDAVAALLQFRRENGYTESHGRELVPYR